MNAGTGEHQLRTLPRLAGGLFVAAILGAYYWIYSLPPRMLGGLDPDRYYHLALSRLISEHGLLKSLPQVEDLGWGRYFPDKEFLFHALTGAADRLGGSDLVLMMVPLLGMAIALCLYLELSRRIRPLPAMLLAALVPLLTPAFLFRLTLLRPHLLAILCFCLLLAAVLRGKPRWTAVACAGFVLAYHAFFVVLAVTGICWWLRRQPGFAGSRFWLWCLAGLAVGIVINPYFPSNLEMGWLSLRLALRMETLSQLGQGIELAALPLPKLLALYGFIPAALLATIIAIRWRKPAAGEDLSRLWFLLLVTGVFWGMGTRSPRAMEYAVPACILMLGYASLLLAWRWWIPLCLALLAGIQGYVAMLSYLDFWQHPRQGAHDTYAAVIAQIPGEAAGKKVFNCEWEAGAFIFYDRPDLRFVDLLEPAFLWTVSKEKYMVRQGLLQGAFADPHLVLRGVFKADYVLCGAPKLIRQMDADPTSFTTLPGMQGEKVRLFAVRPD